MYIVHTRQGQINAPYQATIHRCLNPSPKVRIHNLSKRPEVSKIEKLLHAVLKHAGEVNGFMASSFCLASIPFVRVNILYAVFKVLGLYNFPTSIGRVFHVYTLHDIIPIIK